MPHELHDASYLLQATNQMVVLRKNISNRIEPYTQYPIKKGKKLHEEQWIYGLYGAIDGLSSSFSLLKYFFDIYYANSSLSTMDVADEVHDWMLSPVGILTTTLEATVLISVSIIANQFSGITPLSEDELKTADTGTYLKQRIVGDWPYIRDSIKASKNGYKGVRNVFVFAKLLNVGRDLQYLAMPAGLILGTLSAYNRPWLRKMRFERDSKEKANKKLCRELLIKMKAESQREKEADPQAELRKWRDFKEETRNQSLAVQSLFDKQSISNSFSSAAAVCQWTGLYDAKPQYQSFWFYAYASAAFNGLLDAPYLILGVVSLTVAAPSLWIFSAAALLAMICVVTRVYEEHNMQREFIVTQLALQSALLTREFTGLIHELKTISTELLSNEQLDERDRQALIAEKTAILSELEAWMPKAKQCRNQLKANSVLSLGSLVMCGLKNGIDAFGVIASVMFALASILAMTMTAYPPFLLTFFVAAGIGCLVLFVIDSLLTHFEHWVDMSKVDADPSADSMELCVEQLKNALQAADTTAITPDPINIGEQIDSTCKTIQKKMIVVPSRQNFYQYWFEVPRLLFSGIGKGIRIMDGILLPWQTLGDDGHYHDTDAMMLAAQFSAAIVAMVFALRGFSNASNKSMKRNTLANSAPAAGHPASGADSPTRRERLGTPSPLSMRWADFFLDNALNQYPPMARSDSMPDTQVPYSP